MATAVRNVPRADLWARIVNFLLGVWLFISAFVWPHSQAAQTNTWVLGVLIAVFALVAMARSQLRILNTLAAIWLFFSSLAIFHSNPGTVWNNVIVAIIVFVLSFVGGLGIERSPTVRRPMSA